MGGGDIDNNCRRSSVCLLVCATARVGHYEPEQGRLSAMVTPCLHQRHCDDDGNDECVNAVRLSSQRELGLRSYTRRAGRLASHWNIARPHGIQHWTRTYVRVQSGLPSSPGEVALHLHRTEAGRILDPRT